MNVFLDSKEEVYGVSLSHIKKKKIPIVFVLSSVLKEFIIF